MDSERSTESGLSLSALERIDATCDRFESALKAGTRPHIEDYLHGPGAERSELLRELLALELEYLSRAGDAPSTDHYVRRFARDLETIRDVLRSHQETRSPAGAGSRILAKSWPFSTLPAIVRERLSACMAERRFVPGELVIHQGDSADFLLLILEGEVEVRVRGSDRESRIVARIGEGEVVGEMALVTREARAADVIALESVRALELEAEDFDRLARDFPLLGVALTEIMSSRLGRSTVDGLYSKEFEGYLIKRPLGHGGSAVVYEAEEIGTGVPYALKMLNHCHIYDQNIYVRFQREKEIIAALCHENIVRVYDVFEAYKTFFMSMELCDGTDLSRVVRHHGPLPDLQVQRILGQLARALSHAHERSIIHRDLKPSNVMLTRDGTVKLMDFGLAKPLLDESLTGSDVILGTPAYMPPEQLAGKPVDRRADFYAFGAIAYELITGAPFLTVESSTGATAGRPAQERFPEGLNSDLRDVLTGCLKMRSGERNLDLERVGEWAAEVDGSLVGEG